MRALDLSRSHDSIIAGDRRWTPLFGAMIRTNLAWTLFLVSLAIGGGWADPGLSQSLLIPSESEWTDLGLVLSAGGAGSWDKHLGDDRTGTQGMASPSALIRKNGTYYLYYLGADGLRSTDGGMRHRALGVATSPDGITFTKHPANPIIEFLPNNNEEEGIYSATAFMNDDGDVVLYYGAMDANSPSSTSVNSDVRLAVSSNGVNFTDLGEVVSHDDQSVWGYGDELFPVYSRKDQGTWWVYYLSKGVGTTWDLGVAWGPNMNQLDDSSQALSLSPQVRGGSSSMLHDDDQMIFPTLLRLNNSDWEIQMRTAPVDDPTDLATVEQIYDWNQIETLLVYLDTDIDQWRLYYVDRAATGIYMKTAPAGGRLAASGSKPAAPTDLQATIKSPSALVLTWNDNADDETNHIVRGRIPGERFRRVARLSANVQRVRLRDLIPGQTYIFKVRAKNPAGKSKASNKVRVTLPDG